jgi:hypothetical protein
MKLRILLQKKILKLGAPNLLPTPKKASAYFFEPKGTVSEDGNISLKIGFCCAEQIQKIHHIFSEGMFSTKHKSCLTSPLAGAQMRMKKHSVVGK